MNLVQMICFNTHYWTTVLTYGLILVRWPKKINSQLESEISPAFIFSSKCWIDVVSGVGSIGTKLAQSGTKWFDVFTFGCTIFTAILSG